jgi:hypothetical protein
MGVPVGFVIVSHDKPAQLLRLVRRLIQLYDNPPIVCHHDFSKCSLDGFDFPKEVQFVRPHIDTKWGGLSICLAYCAAMNAMRRRADCPEWFAVLSGTDYPVRPAQAVRDQLTRGGFDAYLEHRLVEYPWVPDPSVEYEAHAFNSTAWVPLAYDRYVSIRLWLPWYSFAQRKPIKIPLATMRSKRLVSLFNPFSETLKCYGGSAWFTLSRKAVNRLLAENAENRAIRAHYRSRFIPDESFPHTILCNQPDLKISSNRIWYIDWSQGGHHPKTLRIEDIPSILASGAHFARKFDLAQGVDVFDAIDAAVDAASR